MVVGVVLTFYLTLFRQNTKTGNCLTYSTQPFYLTLFRQNPPYPGSFPPLANPFYLTLFRQNSLPRHIQLELMFYFLSHTVQTKLSIFPPRICLSHTFLSHTVQTKHGLTVLLQRETASLTFYLTLFRQNSNWTMLLIVCWTVFLSHTVQTKLGFGISKIHIKQNFLSHTVQTKRFFKHPRPIAFSTFYLTLFRQNMLK